MATTVTPFGAERIAIVGDAHLQYIDARAEALLLATLEQIRPTALILNGDSLDCGGLSKFLKSPGDVDVLQAEINRFSAFVRGIKQAVGAETPVSFVVGNHEARLERYLQAAAPALFGLDALKLPSLLRLSEQGIAYTPDGVKLAQGRLLVHHGSRVRNFAGLSAKAELEALRYSVSSITGHTHRMGTVFTTHPFGGAVVGGWEGGTLQSFDTPHLRGKTPDWQQGFVVAHVERDAFSVEMLPFRGHGRKRWTVWQGQRITVN